MMKKLVALNVIALCTIFCVTMPNNLNDMHGAQTRGLVGDLQSTLKETQTALANLPQTLSSLLPTVTNIQKLLLSAAIIGLGYRCCKYGLSKINKAAKLYSEADATDKGKHKYAQSKSYAIAGTGFWTTGVCLLLLTQQLAHAAFGQ